MLRLGALQFDFPVVQAALAGFSDAPMRLIARRHGAPYALDEPILDKLVLQPGGARSKNADLDDEDHPTGTQLMGADAAPLAEAAATLAEAGFDAIDLNFGCSVRKVLGRRRGGYLLGEPSTAIEIIRRVRAAVPTRIPVTVKMRRGMDDSAKSERDFFRILDAALEAGLNAVAVHGRTVKQRYVGPSDWRFIKRVKRHAGDHTVLGSGDLFTADDIVRMFAETEVDGVTVARGAIGNPWVYRETRALLAGEPLPDPPSVAEQGCVIREHFELSVRVHGDEPAARIMRKFGVKYSELHPRSIPLRNAFLESRNAGEWLAVLDEWYDPSRDWPPVRRKTGPGHLVAAGATL